MNKRLAFTGAAVAVAAGFAFLLPHRGSVARQQEGFAAVAARQAAARRTFEAQPNDAYAARWDAGAHGSRTRPTRSEVVVYVAGEVARGGVYRLPASARVVDALHAAGGATAAGDLVAVNLAQPLEDGQEVIVPPRGSSADIEQVAAASNAGAVQRASPGGRHHPRHKRRKHARKHPSSAMQEATVSDISQSPPVDLNAADAAQLESLPGIGPSLADRIVAYRAINGPFASVDDLLDVNGITDTRLQDISPYLVVR